MPDAVTGGGAEGEDAGLPPRPGDDSELCSVKPCSLRQHDQRDSNPEKESRSENSNSETLFYKDRSLGSVKNLSNN